VGHNYKISSKSIKRNWLNGRGNRTEGQTDRQTNFKALPFTNKGLCQDSLDNLHAGNLGLHCTEISENYIKNCRIRRSIWRDPPNYEVFRSQSHS